MVMNPRRPSGESQLSSLLPAKINKYFTPCNPIHFSPQDLDGFYFRNDIADATDTFLVRIAQIQLIALILSGLASTLVSKTLLKSSHIENISIILS